MELAYSAPNRSQAMPAKFDCDENFWVPAQAGGSTNLVIVPAANRSEPVRTALQVFSLGGALTNSLEIISPAVRPLHFNLDSVLAGCPIEHGIRSGTVNIRSQGAAAVMYEMQNGSNLRLAPPMMRVRSDHGAFIPIRFDSNSSPILAVSNLGNDTARLNIRLFHGQRTPDFSVSLGVRSTCLLPVLDEFRDFLGALDRGVTRAFLRIRHRSRGEIGAALFEEQEGSSGRYYEIAGR